MRGNTLYLGSDRNGWGIWEYETSEQREDGRTSAEDARGAPPMFARTGGVRWMRRNVAMKGVHRCDALVRYGRVERTCLRQDEDMK
jgi:hypothetical protein